MITVLFIHGTGTRKAAYRDSLDKIASALSPAVDRVRVIGIDWGTKLGTRLTFKGASIPNYATTRAPALASAGSAPATPGKAEGEDALWVSLDRDPLFEFRVLAGSATAGPLPPNAAQQTPVALETLQGVLDSTEAGAELARRLELWTLRAAYDRARSSVSSEALVRRVLIAQPTPVHRTLARAVIATMLAQNGATDDETEGLDTVAGQPAERDELVDRLASHLEGEVRSATAFVKGLWNGAVAGVVAGAAAAGSPWIIRTRRRSMTDVGSPAIGDILWYQARGARLRTLVRSEIRRLAADGPVVLLAHSLGGIACVDTLLEEPEPGVRLLITAGSQAPYFYEIGALTSRPLPEPVDPSQPPPPLPHELPASFPRWVNFFDPQDLLAYCAAPVFGGRTVDHELDNGLRFPASHSGYWSNPTLWKIALPELLQP